MTTKDGDDFGHLPPDVPAGFARAAVLSNAEEIVYSIRLNHKNVNYAKALLLEDIAIFDELEIAGLYGARSTASWLERELGYPRSTAYEYVKVARKLRCFPLLADAFRNGAIDYHIVRFVITYMTPENEAELVDLAIRLRFPELQKALAGLDESEGPNPDPDEPFFKLTTREDGMVRGEFLLPAVTGELLRSALKIAELTSNGNGGMSPEKLAKLLKTTGADGEPTEDGTVASDTSNGADGVPLEELDDTDDLDDDWGSFGDEADYELLEPLGEPIVEACPGEQTRAAKKKPKFTAEEILRVPGQFGPALRENLYPAFVTMINMIRALPISAVRAPGAQVSIMLTEDGRAWMPQNPQIPSRALANFINNSIARCHLLSTAGLTMHYGRERRLASDAQVTALLEVWGHQCAMPGCTNSRYIEIHHIKEWADGGLTDIENLIPLCSSCHSLVSHGSARITSNGPMLEFTFANGSRFRSFNRSLPELDYTPDSAEFTVEPALCRSR